MVDTSVIGGGTAPGGMQGRRRRGIPAFSVLLIMAVAAIVGIASVPMLNVQYAPTVTGRSIGVSFSWNGASERIMEAEVTSKIEGVLSGMKNCTSISSVSNKGSGQVTLEFRKGTDMAAARFEVASRIRNMYASLPEEVSYPDISLDTRGTGGSTAISYVLKSSLPSMEIEKFVSERLLTPLSSIDGVDKVAFWGATPFELEVEFDSRLASAAGVTALEIADAFNSYFNTEMLGMVRSGDGLINLKLRNMTSSDLGSIPVKSSGGHVIWLRDLAQWRYKESQPTSYFRLNGLNTLTLSVSAAPSTNLLTVVGAVKDRMAELQENFPQEITASVSYDSSEYISGELDKLYFRTLLCILILLVFVYLVNRSWRYLLIISTTLAVNILVAIVIYNLVGLSIHIYTLAGITVSLGIIIDTSIVMVDHYSYYRNRSVFPALLGATATTIGALCVVMLLPEEDKKNLADFSLVIMINLSVALVTSYLFIPSLLDRFPIKRSSYSLSVRRRRRVVKWNRLYSGYIDWGQRHRWVFVAVLVAGFGIPLCVLPAKVAEDKPQEQWNFWERTYNSIMGWRPYADNKNTVDKVVGTSFAMFHKAMNKGNFYREPGRDVLYVNAGMPEGCTVGQLNDVVTSMENYLSQFDQIESFTTNIYSYDNAMIEVRFNPEFEKTSFPAELKAQVMAMASNFGGATWRVWGINDSYFNNNVTTSYKSNRITLTGYNYDELIGYAEVLVDKLSGNRRVSEPEIMSGGWSGFAGNEFNIGYDFEKMAAVGLSPYRYYSVLYSMLYDQGMRDIMINGEMTSTVLRSSQAESFDLWNVQNSQVSVDSLKVKLSEIGSIEKKRTGLSIYRHNQSYEVTVGYDFIGSYELSKSLTETTVKYMNEEVLPVGYKAEVPGYWWGTGKQIQYAWLLLLIIAIIYVMCAMTFESLRLPFAVILMIPVSFIGVFLVFGAFDFPFDQGGFAAFVMLSGIVVNAGIYLINQFQDIRSSARRRRMRSLGYDASCKDVQDSSGRFAVRQYVKAYNHKINPTMLTIISTILGLIPFLFDGPEEVFWFAFATGTIGGMAFSVLALILYLPVFCFRVKRPGRKSKTHPERA